VQVKLQARGSSPRQLAAGATGNVLVTMGPGKVKSGLVETLGGGILGQLTSKLNPFSAKDPYTRLDCTVTGSTSWTCRRRGGPVRVDSREGDAP
jgi:hypothetical protein